MIAERVPLARLHPAPWNPRLIKDHRFQNLCRSIEADPEFLDQRPILAMADGTIYAGNMRYRAAQHLGWADVPAIVSDVPEQLAKERALRDNAAWGENVEQELAELLYELKEAGSAVDLLGFDEAELSRLLDSVSGEEHLGEDDADLTPPADPITKPGDLWLLGDHRLLCGDSTVATDVERLLSGARPLLMVTDPPYGVEYDAAWRDEAAAAGLISHAARRVAAVENDSRVDWTEAWALSPAEVVYCWHADRHASTVQRTLEEAGYEVRCQIIWAKSRFAISRGHYHWQHEPCWYAVKGTAHWKGDRSQTTLWEINLDRNVEGGHSTQKPVECMERPIRNHEGDVYDPFLGSGTTLVAAEKQGRRCWAMEISPAYVDVAVRRWETLTGRKAVLDGPTDQAHA